VSVPGLFVHSVVNDSQTSPRPRALRTDARGVGCSALCVVTGLSRDRDGLDRVTYFVGTGLSWKPIAAAFRFSVSSILAFSLASYSSIDWVTYSWPYLSIL
jgi:hypothetical protein